jgi:putative transposase
MRRASKSESIRTEQARFPDRQFGAVRFVFNTALAIKRHCYKVRGDRLSAKHDLKPLLAIAKWSRRYGWLADFGTMTLQQGMHQPRPRLPQFQTS